MTTTVSSGAREGLPAGTHPLWVVVGAAGLIVAFAIGLRQVMGLYLKPVTTDLGIGREPFSTALAVANLVIGLGSIPAGAIADRYGTGRVVAGGLVLLIAGNYVMYAAQSGDALMWSGILIGLGTACAGINAMVGAVARAAPPDKRGTALAALGMAGGIGNFVAFPYTDILMNSFGWRGSLIGAMVTLAALVPFAYFLSGRPADHGEAAVKPQTLAEAFDEAFRLPSYWLLVIGYAVCGFHVAFFSVHLPAFVADKGLPTWVGVWALTAVGVANIIGTYLAGQSSRHVENRLSLAFIYATRSLIFLAILLLPTTPALVIAASASLGLVWLSTIPLTSNLVGKFFGTTWMSMLYGVVLLSHQIGSFVGLWAAGHLYDATNSYDTMWKICIVVALIGVVIHLPIRERPVPRLTRAPALTGPMT